MLKSGGGADLPKEPLRTEHGRQIGVEHLEGDVPVVLAVARQVHRGHSATTQLAADGVVGVERGLESGPDLRQSTASEGQRFPMVQWRFEASQRR